MSCIFLINSFLTIISFLGHSKKLCQVYINTFKGICIKDSALQVMNNVKKILISVWTWMKLEENRVGLVRPATLFHAATGWTC